MDDTISRKAAIDYCEALMNAERLQQTDDWGYGRERYNQTECIMHHIENMPTAQQWIPCSERMPEKPGKYLVTVKNGNVYAGTFDVISGKFQCAATAWMPLPEPYKENSDV